MDPKLIICMVIFALTLLSYILNKIPMWVTSMLSLAALYVTGCVSASDALGGFSNANTILMGACFIIAQGFRKTSMVEGMCDGLMKLTRGSFQMAYVGYLLLAMLLSNLISSPMVVYAIVSPLLAALCDRTGESRSKYIFPMMVVCVGCCGTLPLATAVQHVGEYNGFMETYGFAGAEVTLMDTFIARWPINVLLIAWGALLAPKMCPQTPVMEISAIKQKAKTATALTPFQDKAGIIIFCGSMLALVFSSQLGLATWFIAMFGALMMVLFSVLDQRAALSDIPWDMLMLFVGALALGAGLTNTGAGEMIGNWLATAVGGTHNSYVLGALFFVIPFIITQFMLNRSVNAVFVPICLLTCSALGASPIGLVQMVKAGSLTAFITPMATPAVAMAMADGGYDLKALLKSGWLVSILLCVGYVFYTMTVFPAF